MNTQTFSTSVPLNLRAISVKTLMMVQQGQSLTSLLNDQLQQVPSRDKALFHELVVGTLRQWFALKAVALPLFSKPVNHVAVETCVYLGLYQLLFTRIADHASISETVEACKQLGYSQFSGVVNAILRRVTRDIEQFRVEIEQVHGLPSWLFKRLKKDWGEASKEICQQLKHVAPLTLRVNQRKISRHAYCEQLDTQHVSYQLGQYSPVAIQLKQNIHIPELVGYSEGWFSVQDEHAQLCADVLPCLDDAIVIDACAAPGGKTTHILEKYQPQQIIALDIDEQRLKKIDENLERLQLKHQNIQLFVADATQWQSPQLADCIIVDAPCSATGVIRRHPDIQLLRQSTDIAALVELQRFILNQMWQQLKVGGVMLYMTCSLLKVENEQQMRDFFAQHSDAQEVPIQANWGIAQHHGRQLFPQHDGGDGFYYCLIQKVG